MNLQRDSEWVVVILLGSILSWGQTAIIDQGTVLGGTYVNRFFGLAFIAPTVLSDEPNQGPPRQQDRAFVLIKAVGKTHPGHVTSLMFLSVDKLSYYPSEERSAAGYLNKMEQYEKEDGYIVLQRPPSLRPVNQLRAFGTPA